MKKTFFIIVLVLVLIQFFRIDKTNLPVDPKQDYVNITNAPVEIRDILKRSCYDCHSNEINYPWYANIAPVSWYIKEHVNQGKDYLNFSEFGKYNKYQKEHIYTGLVSTTERGSMPLKSYVWLHKEAALSLEDRKLLLDWFVKFLPETLKD